MPAYKAAAVVGAAGGQQSPVIRATRDGQCVVVAIWHGHDAAMGAVAVDAAVDDGADLAVGDARCAVWSADKSRSEFL